MKNRAEAPIFHRAVCAGSKQPLSQPGNCIRSFPARASHKGLGMERDMKLIPALACNIVIFAWTLYCMALYFIGEDRRPDLKKGCASLKFFTTLSNVFSAFASAAWIIPEIRMLGGAAEEIGRGLFLWKFMGTVSVTVTLLTVLFFLGPNMGYKPLFEGSGLYLHLIGPVLALLAFCLFEKGTRLSAGDALFALLPTALYGSVYLYKVVGTGKDNGGWEDFYGFNKNGRWKVSIAAMLAATQVIGLVIMLLHNL